MQETLLTIFINEIDVGLRKWTLKSRFAHSKQDSNISNNLMNNKYILQCSMLNIMILYSFTW